MGVSHWTMRSPLYVQPSGTSSDHTGSGCRGSVAGQDRCYACRIVLLVSPLGPHADLADLVVGQRPLVQAGIP